MKANFIKILLGFIFISTFNSLHSQNLTRLKFRSENEKIVYLNKNSEFESSTSWLDSINIVVFEIEAKRIRIYGTVTKSFDFTNQVNKYSEGDYNYYLFSPCLDKDGVRCNIRLKLRNEKNGLSFLYIDYKNIVYQYVIKVDSN